jgi:hypothetical protein
LRAHFERHLPSWACESAGRASGSWLECFYCHDSRNDATTPGIFDAAVHPAGQELENQPHPLRCGTSPASTMRYIGRPESARSYNEEPADLGMKPMNPATQTVRELSGA